MACGFEEGPCFSPLSSIMLSLTRPFSSISYHGDGPITTWHLAQEIQEQAGFPAAPAPIIISSDSSTSEFLGLLVHRRRVEYPNHSRMLPIK